MMQAEMMAVGCAVKRKWTGNFVAVSCAFISLSLCSVGRAQSEPPPPSGGEEKQQAAQEAKKADDSPGAANRGTESAPLVVRISGTPEVKALAYENQNKANPNSFQWGSGAEWATAILAALALGITLWQLGHFRAQLSEMRRSDERQLRPYIGLRMEGQTNLGVGSPQLEFICTNYGKSPAIKLGYRFYRGFPEVIFDYIEFGPNGPTEVTGDFRGNGAITVFPDSKESISKIRFTLEPDLDESDVKLLTSDPVVSLLVGIEVEYFDVFGRRYTSKEYFSLSHGTEPYLVPGGSRIT